MNEEKRVGEEIADDVCDYVAGRVMELTCEDPKTYERIYNHCWNRLKLLAGGKA